MAEVTLEQIGAARAETLDNLFQLYVHDFSVLWFDRTDIGELQENGRFPSYIGAEKFWTEPRNSAWLIRADGKLAGFALLGIESHSGLAAATAWATAPPAG